MPVLLLFKTPPHQNLHLHWAVWPYRLIWHANGNSWTKGNDTSVLLTSTQFTRDWTAPELLLYLGVSVYTCFEGKHTLSIINMAVWTVCLSQDNRSSSSQSHCSLLGFTFPSTGSLLCCSACWSRLGACLKLNRCQSLVDSRSLWIIASYLLLWYDGERRGKKVGTFAGEWGTC